ncbi:papilin-like [Amblyomma americanum]
MKLLLLLALCGAAIAQRNFACMPYVDPGPCRGLFPRYYYSSQERTCLSFLYGGCKGNLNNFVTFEECKASCAPTSDHERRCLARPEEGPCNGRAIMWGYNVTLRECQMFTYGGCDGSDNKYETKTMCEIVCKSDLPVHLDPACLKPKYTGPCAGYFPRYYYNNSLKTCEQFIYGGCLSNGNNFVTIEECKNKCWVSPDQGSVEVTTAFDVPLWLYRAPRSQVILLLGTGNRFCCTPSYAYAKATPFHHQAQPSDVWHASGTICADADRKALQDKRKQSDQRSLGSSGSDAATSVTRFALVADRAPRSQVILLLGTGNRFCCTPSYAYAKATPFHHQAQPSDVWHASGTICADADRKALQDKRKQSDQRSLGSSGSDAATSVTRFALVAADGGYTLIAGGDFNIDMSISPPEVCNYPVDSGPCLAHMLRFFYNTVTKSCEQFVYSGCGGNQNNFRTYGACEKKCEKFMGVIPRA